MGYALDLFRYQLSLANEGDIWRSNDDHNLKDWNGTRNQTKIAFPSSFRNLILNGIVQDDFSKGSNLKKSMI